MVHDVKHNHHIVPKYEGGSDDPSNLVELTVTQHAMWHFAEWTRKKDPRDKLAWTLLLQEVSSEERFRETRRLGGSISGPITVSQKIGIHGLTPEQIKENAKKGGEISGPLNRDLYCSSGEGLWSEESKRKAKEVQKRNQTGFFSSDVQSELGKRAAEKNKINGTGAFFDKAIQSNAGKVGSKITNSQKWRCTVTGYITTSGPLTCYQKARGIDPSNREMVTG